MRDNGLHLFQNSPAAPLRRHKVTATLVCVEIPNMHFLSGNQSLLLLRTVLVFSLNCPISTNPAIWTTRWKLGCFGIELDST